MWSVLGEILVPGGRACLADRMARFRGLGTISCMTRLTFVSSLLQAGCSRVELLDCCAIDSIVGSWPRLTAYFAIQSTSITSMVE